MVVNNPLISPYFLGGGGIGGVPLDCHDCDWWIAFTPNCARFKIHVLCNRIVMLCLKSEGRLVCLYKHFVDTHLKINIETKKQKGQLKRKII